MCCVKREGSTNVLVIAKFLSYRSRWMGLGLGLLLMGCSPAPSSQAASQSSPIIQASTDLGQSLPITAQATISQRVIQLEVAKTPQEQEVGLMGRTSLGDDRGMLFVFSPARPTQFWMKNTLIKLDMVFLNKGVVQSIAMNVPPCTSDPCPTYGSTRDVIDQVIELRGGRSTTLGLKVGDRVPVQFLKTNRATQN